MPRHPATTDPVQPDLFTLPSRPEPRAEPAASPTPPRHGDRLGDPESFVGGLDDADLRRLLEAALAEARRRRLLPQPYPARLAAPTAMGLPPGKEAAVRAALASGLSARLAAKQFGVPAGTVKAPIKAQRG